jgi:hypothetical protein
MNVPESIYVPCSGGCGALVVDADLHSRWHASLAAVAPVLEVATTTFNPNTGVSDVPILTDEEQESLGVAKDLRDGARAALVVNQAYLDLTAPTAAQTRTQVSALTRQVNALVRLNVGDLTATAAPLP